MDWSGFMMGYAQLTVGAITAVVGAFVGAFAAFRLESKRREVEQLSKDAESLQTIMFMLSFERIALLDFRTKFLEPYRKLQAREFYIPAVNFSPPLSSYKIDHVLLVSLLRRDSAHLSQYVMQIDALSQSLQTLMGSRCETHCLDYQPQLTSMKKEEYGSSSIEEIEAGVDYVTRQKLKRYTDELYDECDRIIDVLYDAIALAFLISGNKFPNTKFVLYGEFDGKGLLTRAREIGL